ncbi:MAG TPA: glycosyltransferase family 4 protein [Cyclobacteriaceae bacterium]|nr:glycosyltransferase family 4 protein [Cyclobacteriaceae bacterium]
MKKKILIIDNSTGITGAFKAIFYMADSIRHKYDFHFSIPPTSRRLREMITEKKYGILLIDFLELKKNLSVLLYFPSLILNSLRLIQFCRREKIDIVHVNDLYNLTGIVIKLVRPSTKVIYHLRLLSTSYGKMMYKFWARIINRFADKIIVVSEVVNLDAKKYIKISKVELIYDFISLEEAYNIEASASSVVRFLYLGNYVKGKGHKYAIEAFSKALVSNRGMKLTFAGGYLGRAKNIRYKRTLQQEVVKHSLSDYVVFQDISDEVEKLIKTHDVVLNFSESESFSMTCYEALYYGKPVIATYSGGPSELIENNSTGLLVPCCDTDSMARALLDLANSKEKRELFGKRGRDSLRARAVANDPNVKIDKIYQSL